MNGYYVYCYSVGRNLILKSFFYSKEKLFEVGLIKFLVVKIAVI